MNLTNKSVASNKSVTSRRHISLIQFPAAVTLLICFGQTAMAANPAPPPPLTAQLSPSDADVPGANPSDASSASAPAPAQCTHGCIPFSDVETIRGDGSITRTRCTFGCVATEEVNTYKIPPPPPPPVAAPPAATLPAAGSTGAAGAPPVLPPDPSRPVDGGMTRMVWQPTAIGLKKKEFRLLGLGAGYWQMEAGVTDHFMLGGAVVLPVFIIGGGITAKVHSQIGENAAISVSGIALSGGPYFDDIDAFIIVEAIQPTVTFFSSDHTHMFNISLAIGGFQFCDKDHDDYYYNDHGSSGYECESEGGVLLAPRLGYRVAVHRKVALQLEWIMPMETEWRDMNGQIHFISYGIQFHGDTLYSDIGFLFPAIADVTDEIIEIFPLGIPYFTLGFKI
ncbi:MAG: hypothetical protein JXX14_25480 [Deltaproteobacteria bacterium]|nr:hypothetical protein [Deltaproteobacteria bacterium]